MEEGKFYRVSNDPYDAPLRDYLEHGFESRREYLDAVCRLVRLWHGRIGECIEERNGFRRLCFHDTPGGKPDEAWLPVYLLTETEAPEYMCEHIPTDEIEEEINDAFGFD